MGSGVGGVGEVDRAHGKLAKRADFDLGKSTLARFGNQFGVGEAQKPRIEQRDEVADVVPIPRWIEGEKGVSEVRGAAAGTDDRVGRRLADEEGCRGVPGLGPDGKVLVRLGS